MSLPIEIERKFLVRGAGWLAEASAKCFIRQGYLNQPGGATIRVRRGEAQASLAIKSFRNALSRVELEYDIPIEHADYLLDSVCDRVPVAKVRHMVVVAGAEWVVDVYEGANQGLVTAEIELVAADQPVALPDWIGPEVTADPRFSNSRLYRYPYAEWRVRPQTTPAPLPQIGRGGHAGVA